MKTDVYNIQGKKAGSVELPKALFETVWNPSLMHQVVVTMQSNARTPVAYAKDRSEVAGGGRKPWRQKGTGRARHGSIRSPLWKGGGVTFGPHAGRVFTKHMNKKMRAKALFVALSQKLRDSEILFVDELSFEAPKTAEARGILKALSGIKGFESLLSKRNNSVLLVLPEESAAIKKSFSNFGNVEVEIAQNINALEVLTYKHVVVVAPEKSIAIFQNRFTNTNKKEEVDKRNKKLAAKN